METIGDAYMIVGGVPHPTPDHADRVVRMGFGMIDVTESVFNPVDQRQIQVRINLIVKHWTLNQVIKLYIHVL